MKLTCARNTGVLSVLAVMCSKASVGAEGKLKLKTSAPNVVEVNRTLTLTKVSSTNISDIILLISILPSIYPILHLDC
jgi:hypothetical protein